MQQQSLIERTRNRLVLATLAWVLDENGCYYVTVKLPNGTKETVQLDADILTKALKKLFEALVYDTNKRIEAEKKIASAYSDSVNIKVGKLTNRGEGFMADLIENLIEQAFSERGE